MSQFRSDPVPTIEPVVYPAACLAEPIDEADLNRPSEPPMPEPLERPAGQPSARTWSDWVAYEARRRERAELAGLFWQGEADAFRNGFGLTREQLDQCVSFIRGQQ